MFTGIVEATGRVVSLKGATLQLNVPAPLSRLKKGGSLAVNGVCLTVVKSGQPLSFNLVKETVRRSTLGALKRGDAVNLERPLKSGGRLDGHFVLGHVDGVGRVTKIDEGRRERSIFINYPDGLRRYFVEKGSVTVDGVSLTLGKVGRGGFWLHFIPHTLDKTISRHYALGDRVNLEADLFLLPVE